MDRCATQRRGSKPTHHCLPLRAIPSQQSTTLCYLVPCIRQHHPVSVSAYYEEQKEAALLKAKDVRENRIPKFLGYFNSVLEQNGTGYLVGGRVTYADLAVYHILDGLHFAFPKLCKQLEEGQKYSALFALKQKIESHDKVAAYLKSDRRVPYSNGVFVSRAERGLIPLSVPTMQDHSAVNCREHRQLV